MPCGCPGASCAFPASMALAGPLERLRRGDRHPPAGSHAGNRIHVEDLVTACAGRRVRDARRPRGSYNVTDGTDDSLTAYLQRVARIGNLPPPPLISLADAQAFSSLSWSFLSESRRIDNRRMLDELGVALAFHDLDAGIRASLVTAAGARSGGLLGLLRLLSSHSPMGSHCFQSGQARYSGSSSTPMPRAYART